MSSYSSYRISLCLSVFAAIAVNSLFAQTPIQITGKVLDGKSKNPLPYAGISLKNSSLGTVSNEAGEFVFFVPAELENDTLMVSYIGYKTYKERISNHADLKIIALEESPTVLGEITVSADAARKLVEEAVKAIPRVYPTTPYLMEGFHRSWEKVDWTDSISYPGTLIEAAVTIYDPGYGQVKPGKKANEEIYLNEIRRSAMMEGWDYGSGNSLRDLLNKNLVKYNRANTFIFLKSFLDFPNNLIYEWEGTTEINGEDLSIVRIEVPNSRKFPAFYKVYLCEVDHAILRFDFYGTKKEIDYSMGPWHTEDFNETYIFRRYQKRPYLSYVRKQYTIKNLDLKNKKVLRTEIYYKELLVNNLITADPELKRKSLSGQKSQEVSFARQSKGYHEDFWKTYNVVKENPLDQEIIRYFEKNGKVGNPP